MPDDSLELLTSYNNRYFGARVSKILLIMLKIKYNALITQVKGQELKYSHNLIFK
ncbi:MAG: hypothetical protein PHN56_00335 [Candidatus Nanoarchaeia archaeon]|nr:hypothetical protein [Candidatus Nanoarchaeia archaeon]